MTTGLVRGMSIEKAAAAVCERARQEMERAGAPFGIWTETGNRSVLVGIARRGRHAATLLIPREEYDGLRLLAALEAGEGIDG